MRKILPAVLLAILLAGIISTVVLRTFLVYFCVDPATGFYIGNYSLPMYALNILTLVFVVLLLVLPLCSKRLSSHSSVPAKNMALCFLSIVSAIVLAVYGVERFVQVIAVSSSAGAFLDGLFALASAVYFAWQAAHLRKGTQMHSAALVALIPVLWAILHLIVRWMSFTTIISIPAALFETLQMISFMLFFYYHARSVAEVKNGHEMKGLLSFGLLSVFLGILSTVPQIIASCIGAHNITVDWFSIVLILVLSIYALVQMFSVFFIKNTKILAK
ncbi:MAG TPA: hypothetical protein DEP42_06035 [Ruminococcaceae bacterium]|nr:hypothetical protein [Oscillospiraceae bacterium]